ncbi:4-hydroxy-tetrahydrodipicolinate reductase [Nocardioides panzhihuensis]|uniref:4-hydroxy-tetrahydrodipicolinate reductase n=1 Tax=Nocardioides panzhihuensis TaxID=860243 RepID=A0A7Z0IQY8_9ACTN|nr:4-hydroxy-tetrahydrodipicolinate reductase [Nocardioides panzhihuensis]NYI76429.1 4-hydroxy-tetrahydrodipicolinate reductase [Nocardioides panzhihuensis]
MIKVAVLGAGGKLGSAVCEAVESADDLELVARIGRGDVLSTITDAGAEVAVDVTTLEAVMGNAEFCLSHGVHTVIGTSGFGPDRVEQLGAWLAEAPGVGAMVVPNFSVGAVLMMRFAELAAAHFPSVEIVETHHERKADAPSGTARRTAELVAAARREAGVAPAPDATTSALQGARGAAVEGIPVHSLRMAGSVAHQEVVLGGVGELLTIRHDSLSHASFAHGVLAAIRGIGSRPGLTVGLEDVLGLG